MSEPFTAEVRIFAGNFAPRGWAFCNGQLLPIAQNTALFSLIGTTYGGDGRTTFGLPDLRGRIPLHYGQGPGMTNRRLGEKGGTENVTVAASELPSHSHVQQVTNEGAETQNPAGALYAQLPSESLYRTDGTLVSMASNSLSNTGGSAAHYNLMPSLCINFIIALWGIYPSRN